MRSCSIDKKLIENLIAHQFPQWKHLPVEKIQEPSWDHKIFRLGSNFLVRLPSAQPYASQIPKEQAWLLKLAPHLPCAIPKLVATGKPDLNYPFHWAIYEWIGGNVVKKPSISVARDLANFLMALHQISIANAPKAGEHNFYRGGLLQTYHEQVEQALKILGSSVDKLKIKKLWQEAISTNWNQAPVWVHGDISPGNLLIENNRLKAVIDFGLMCVGDPACDLVIAWTFFDEPSRKVFCQSLNFEISVWLRAKGWALWKALIIKAGLSKTNACEYQDPDQVIEALF